MSRASDLLATPAFADPENIIHATAPVHTSKVCERAMVLAIAHANYFQLDKLVQVQPVLAEDWYSKVIDSVSQLSSSAKSSNSEE